MTERTVPGHEMPFTFVTRKNFVVVVCSVGDGVVMIEQWRHAVGRRLWELPQGAQEHDEDVTTSAARELQEETGWVGTDFAVAAGELYEAADWATQSFAVVTCGAEEQRAPQLERDEAISQSRVVPLTELVELVRSGAIQDAATLASLALVGVLERGNIG